MSSETVKLKRDQHQAVLSALPSVIDRLQNGSINDRLVASLLTEVLIKMHKQSIEVKPEYKLKLTKPQEIAFVIAGLQGEFNGQMYLRVTTDMISHKLLRSHL